MSALLHAQDELSIEDEISESESLSGESSSGEDISSKNLDSATDDFSDESNTIDATKDSSRQTASESNQNEPIQDELNEDSLDGDKIVDEANEEDVNFDDFAEEDNNQKNSDKALKEEKDINEIDLEPLEADEKLTDKAEEVKPDPVVEKTPEPEQNIPPSPPFLSPEPVTTQSVNDNQPDLNYESKLYDIYLNYYSKKLTDQEWQTLIGERQSEIYRIQPGDTLWGISKTFFNDGNYWPKIWQMNSSITNPHLIQTGNTIHFLLGTESETPAFAVTEGGEESLSVPLAEGEDDSPSTKVAGDPTGNSNSPSDEIEIPPPSVKYNPVLRKIPLSLPESIITRTSLGVYDDLGVDYGHRPILDLKETKYLESFIDEENLPFDGVIQEIEGSNRTAAALQYVYVTFSRGKARIGELYTVIEKNGPVERVNDEIAARDLGFRYQILGETKLTELLSSSSEDPKNPTETFRALVTKSLTHVPLGSRLVKGAIPLVNTISEGEKGTGVFQLIGASLVDYQKTYSLYSIAFISGGESKGLKPGQVYTIRANTRVRNPDSKVKESYIPIGKIKIAKVGKNFSTGIIVKVWDSIFVGDITGEGKVLPPEKETDRNKKTARSSSLEDSSSEMNIDESLEPETDANQSGEDDFNEELEL